MIQQIEKRLVTLKGEYYRGQTQLHQLENQVTTLRETLLRISGAVLALEELLSSSASVTPAEQQFVPSAHAVGQGRGEDRLQNLTLDKKEN